MTEPAPIPFAWPEIGEAEIAAVAETMRSGWLTTGPRSAAFEQAFAAFVGGGVEAVSVASATAGMEVALAAFDIGPGDEVITSVHTFTATAEAIARRGARPVLVDVEADTLNLDPARVAAAVTPRTRALLPVHFAGLACDLPALRTIAARHGLVIIEDAAHALPTRQAGQMIGGGSSDASVFSFYANKTITTGEGGMVTFVDPARARRARALRLHGISRDAVAFDVSGGDRWRYEVVEEGLKGNLSDILAAIGTVQLGRAWDFHRARTAIAAGYDAGLADLPVRLPTRAPEGDLHSHHIYTLRLRPEAPIERTALCAGLAAAGIQTSLHFIPLARHPHWVRTLGLEMADFPNSEAAYRCSLSLPIFPGLRDADQARVIACIRGLLS